MNKNIVRAIIPQVVITVLLVAYFFYNSSKSNIFTCVADVDFTVRKDNMVLRLDSDYDFIITSNDKNYIHINGTLSVNNRDYQINRTYFMNFVKKTNESYYDARILNLEINKIDNVPKDIFELYFITQSGNTPLYLKISSLNNNLYVIEGLKRTHFTCLKK